MMTVQSYRHVDPCQHYLSWTIHTVCTW